MRTRKVSSSLKREKKNLIQLRSTRVWKCCCTSGVTFHFAMMDSPYWKSDMACSKLMGSWHHTPHKTPQHYFSQLMLFYTSDAPYR